MAPEHQKTALITGASVGIGYELARLFARDGYRLVLVSRHIGRLEEAKSKLEKESGTQVLLLPKDLAKPSSVEEIVSELKQGEIRVHVLVNNAGFGIYGAFTETDIEDEVRMIQLNLVSLTRLTKSLLKEMLRNGGGKILNVASTAAFQPGPLMAVYYASKAYVLSFSEALSNELSGTLVTVTVLNPGPTRTGFQKRAGVRQINPYNRFGIMDARTVAEAGYRGLMKGKTSVIPGWFNRLLIFSNRLGPRSTSAKVVRYLQEKRGSAKPE